MIWSICASFMKIVVAPTWTTVGVYFVIISFPRSLPDRRRQWAIRTGLGNFPVSNFCFFFFLKIFSVLLPARLFFPPCWAKPSRALAYRKWVVPWENERNLSVFPKAHRHNARIGHWTSNLSITASCALHQRDSTYIFWMSQKVLPQPLAGAVDKWCLSTSCFFIGHWLEITEAVNFLVDLKNYVNPIINWVSVFWCK